MQIYWNKRKRLHKKRVQLPEDWFRTPTCMATVSLFWDTNMATMTSCENTQYPKFVLRDLSEISRWGGGWKQGGSQLFETAGKGGVMKNGSLKGGG